MKESPLHNLGAMAASAPPFIIPEPREIEDNVNLTTGVARFRGVEVILSNKELKKIQRVVSDVAVEFMRMGLDEESDD